MAVYSLTLADIRAAVLSQQQEEVDDPGWLNNAVLDPLINKAHNLICELTGSLKKKETPSVTALTAGYSLPSDWISTSLVQYNFSDRNKRLPFMPYQDYMAKNVISDSNPSHYTIDEISVKLVFYPTPSGSGETYIHEYIALPQALVNPNDVPFNGIARLQGWGDEIVTITNNFVIARAKNLPMTTVVDAFRKRAIELSGTVSSGSKVPVFSRRRQKAAPGRQTGRYLDRYNIR